MFDTMLNYFGCCRADAHFTVKEKRLWRFAKPVNTFLGKKEATTHHKRGVVVEASKSLWYAFSRLERRVMRLLVQVPFEIASGEMELPSYYADDSALALRIRGVQISNS
jgi:hypothetical protein